VAELLISFFKSACKFAPKFSVLYGRACVEELGITDPEGLADVLLNSKNRDSLAKMVGFSQDLGHDGIVFKKLEVFRIVPPLPPTPTPVPTPTEEDSSVMFTVGPFPVNNPTKMIVDGVELGHVWEGTFKNMHGRHESVVIKISRGIGSGMQDIEKEISVYRHLKDNDQNGARSTGCVVMLYDTDKYLVLGKFGSPLNSRFMTKEGVRRIIAEDIVAALSDLHSFGYAHCDLKPQNILVNDDLVVKLVDLDSCTKVGEPYPHHDGKLKCTPAWQSSEVYFGRAGELVTEYSVDIFAAGLIFMALFSKTTRHPGFVVLPDVEKLGGVFGSQKKMNSLLSTGNVVKDEVLHSMCDLNPDSRPHLNDLKERLFPSGTTLQPANEKLKSENSALKRDVVDILAGMSGTMMVISSDIKHVDAKLDSLLTTVNQLFSLFIKQLQGMLTETINTSLETHSRMLLSELHSVANMTCRELKLIVNSNATVTTKQIADVVDKCSQKYECVVERCGVGGNIVEEMKLNNKSIVDAIKNCKEDSASDNKLVTRLLEQVFANTSTIQDEIGKVKYKLDNVLNVINGRFNAFSDDLATTLVNKMQPGMIEQNNKLVNTILNASQKTSDELMLQIEEQTLNTSNIKQSLLDLQVGVITGLESMAGYGVEMTETLAGKMNEVIDAIDANADDVTKITTMCREVIDNTQNLSSDMKVVSEQLCSMQVNIENVGADVRLVLGSNEILAADVERLHANVIQLNGEQCEKMETYQRDMNELNDDLSAGGSDRVKKYLQGELQSVQGMLQALLQETHSVPTLVTIFPKPKTDVATASGLKSKLKNVYKITKSKIKGFVTDTYILQFVCAHTMQPVPCGPDGTGYEIKQDKAWIKKVAPVITVALCVLQAALMVHGIPLSIPIGGGGSGNTVSGEEIFEAAIGLFGNGVSSDTTDNPFEMEEQTRQAYESIKSVLETVDRGLKHTGLVKKICVESGKVAWIKDDEAVIESFNACKGGRMPVPVVAASTSSVIAK